MPLPFTGELMTCIMCGRQERSSADWESNWRMVQLDPEHKYYACPGEFPADGSGADAFKKAYTRILSKIIATYEESLASSFRMLSRMS